MADYRKRDIVQKATNKWEEVNPKEYDSSVGEVYSQKSFQRILKSMKLSWKKTFRARCETIRDLRTQYPFYQSY